MLRLSLAILFAVTPAAASAASGDVYRCTVSDFVNTSGASDADFVERNKEKTFDIFEQSGTYTVVSKSAYFKPSATDYRVVAKTLLQDNALADSAVMFDTLTISNLRTAPTFEASLIVQSPGFANLWLLICVALP